MVPICAGQPQGSQETAAADVTLESQNPGIQEFENSRIVVEFPVSCILVSVRIALLGTRGIPANYGGFETFAEELSTRLAKRGHQVTVYGRSNNIQFREPTYN